jgi:hypothetical protein
MISNTSIERYYYSAALARKARFHLFTIHFIASFPNGRSAPFHSHILIAVPPDFLCSIARSACHIFLLRSTPRNINWLVISIHSCIAFYTATKTFLPANVLYYRFFNIFIPLSLSTLLCPFTILIGTWKGSV